MDTCPLSNEGSILNDMAKNLVLWIIIAVVLMSVFSSFSPNTGRQSELEYSEFIEQVNDGEVQSVLIQEEGNGSRVITGKLKDGREFSTYGPEDNDLVNDLLKENVVIRSERPEQRSILVEVLISWFPLLLLIGVWIFFMRQMQGGGGGRGAMSFGKSRARLQGCLLYTSPSPRD